MEKMRSSGPQFTNVTIRTAITAVTMLALLAGCNLPDGQRPVANTQPPATPSSTEASGTPSPASPTATTEPMAASVNGEGITVAEFEAELVRYRASEAAVSQPALSEAEQEQVVLQDLIDQVLLAQAAFRAGFSLGDTALDQRIADLANRAGGEAALAEWKKQNDYDDTSFRAAIKRGAAAAWQRDQVIEQVPVTAEQVHARQILVYSREEAQSIVNDLIAGADFATLALQYDALTGGELGWFPRGYLLSAEVEAATFALQPGEYSEIIESKAGFHIVQVIERDAQHLLSPDALQMFQKQALSRWIEEQRSQSKIEILLR